MNNLIFWIIVCSWLIPMGIRMYNRSRQRRFQDFPPQNYPGQPYPPQHNPVGYPEQPPVVIPAEPQPPMATPARQAVPPSSATPQASGAPQPNSAPQGYRARKLAELDQEYSDGKIAMEDYMKLRQEIMNG
ncbi:hypothetical protein BMF89_04080 [Arthrobacter sp. SRS-W-1-2016]|uniref:hypothetical protein n=1 Tax=Arthrobacter sp. SRS-W-1-2016 TaxID=1930254 RepID=UPI0009912162|nr:hypothetical protein [Arthrobacter sp. SRS-W-1-2016]OOP64410.1 hypothetical protein BMF89_04080 [Arthrobacter sp. SRS-W-1-2016]